MKKFSTTGICTPGKHYMADISRKADQIAALVREGASFSIRHPRQYGKTTMLFRLKQLLQPSCYVLSTTFQSIVAEDLSSEPAFVRYFLSILRKSMVLAGCPEHLISAWTDLSPVQSGHRDLDLAFLRDKVDLLCGTADRPIVLMIDEVDSASSYSVFARFLDMLRDMHLHPQQHAVPTFQSVILAGISDVRQVTLQSDDGLTMYSPWDFATDCPVDLSFSEEEIAGMLREYEADHRIGMDIPEIASLLHAYTSGYPFLASRICKEMDEQLACSPQFPTLVSVWTREGFLTAVEEILNEGSMLISEMVEVVKAYPDVEHLLHSMLFEGFTRPFNADSSAVRIGRMYGFFARRGSELSVSNRIIRICLTNYYLDKEPLTVPLRYSAQNLKARFAASGHLDMDLVLSTFQELYPAVYDSTDSTSDENGRKIFLRYLRTIINGTGHYYTEDGPKDSRSLYVFVDYRGERFMTALRVWHGPGITAAEEEEHLLRSLDACRLDQGWMLSLSPGEGEHAGVHEYTLAGKVIREAVVRDESLWQTFPEGVYGFTEDIFAEGRDQGGLEERDWS